MLTCAEAIAFLGEQEILVEFDGAVARKQPAGLQLDEGGGDDEELRCHLEVHGPHQVEMGEVLRHEIGQSQLGDLETMGSDQLQEQIEAVDGWNLKTHVDIAMDAMVLPPDDTSCKVLSGGEARRVALCKMLLQKPDIILLDISLPEMGFCC